LHADLNIATLPNAAHQEEQVNSSRIAMIRKDWKRYELVRKRRLPLGVKEWLQINSHASSITPF
jgi:hypothetical protein